VHDDRVQVLLREHRVVVEYPGRPELGGHLGDLHAERQLLQRYRMADHRASTAQRSDQPLPPPGPDRVWDDRAEQRAPAADQQAGAVEPGQHRLADRIRRVDQQHRRLPRQAPPDPERGRAYPRHVRAVGQQQLDQFVAEPLPGRAGLGLLQDESVRGRRGELVDEDEHRLGQGSQHLRGHAGGERGTGDVVPRCPRADLVRGQQRGHVAPLPPLDPPDLLEQLALGTELGD
jgi:hypothetical protein